MLEDTADVLHLPQRRNVRLDTLLRLRWLAIIGQTTAVLVVQYAVEFPLPIWACLAVIALSAWLNVALRLRFSLTQRLEPERAAWLLAFDIAELAVLLFLTGGLENPFAFLFLAPGLLSATALPPRITIMLGAFAVLCATVLVFVHYPLPWDADDPLELPWIYLLASGFRSCSRSVSSASMPGRSPKRAGRLPRRWRDRARARARATSVAARRPGGAAAHELGTPLSTISVVVKELELRLEAKSPACDDVRLLREQAQRCRDIWPKLTELSAGEPFDRMPLPH
jgi:two-component system sensor histidine kinase RegB